MTLTPSVNRARDGHMTDIDFEQSVRTLARIWDRFRADPSVEDDFHRLCRALREAKLRFADIDRWYGTLYDASGLRLLTKDIAKSLPRVLRSRYGPSIRRHLREIDSLFNQRNRRSTSDTALYASSIA